MFRHVNNVHQQEYLDVGKTDYYHRVLQFDALIHNPTLMIVSTKSDFIEQVRYEDDTVVRTRVERVGTKSITIRQQIVCVGTDIGAGAGANDEKICTESESTLVCFDLRTQQTLEVPAGWRERIGDIGE
jgi:acyl-CoA thioester hydrolase